LSEKEKQQLSQLYPAGEYEVLRRLEAFLEEKVRDNAEARNMVCGQTTSILSPYFASGLLSVRTSIEYARRANKGSLQHGDPGLVHWIGEVAWREFYRHVLVHWPFIWQGLSSPLFARYLT
jgi:deoxyribodipyrimidine photo-lyase